MNKIYSNSIFSYILMITTFIPPPSKVLLFVIATLYQINHLSLKFTLPLAPWIKFIQILSSYISSWLLRLYTYVI